jgi:hypothetical protein
MKINWLRCPQRTRTRPRSLRVEVKGLEPSAYGLQSRRSAN